MPVNGWRRYTPALDAVRVLAERYPSVPRVAKHAALIVVKKCGAHLGLNAGALYVLDSLFAVSLDQDWSDPEGRPIVWPSNTRLCEQTGLSLPSLHRHLRALIEAQLICPADSPNGQRWGRRDGEGRIVEAYGFDLSPIAVRHPELATLAARLDAERAQYQALRREHTVLRRSIGMILETAHEHGIPGSWRAYEQALAMLLRRAGLSLEELERRVDGLRALLERVQDAYRTGVNSAEVIPKSPVADMHIPTTTQPEILVDSNAAPRCRADARQSQESDAASGGLLAFKKEPASAGPPAQEPEPRRVNAFRGVNLDLVSSACPELQSYFPRSLETWNDLCAAAAVIRPWLGISDDAWQEACEAVGADGAAICVAVILEKGARGQVSSPGGYLRGMTEKARRGVLRMTPTLFGLLRPGERSGPSNMRGTVASP